jgi:hypothetical protein
MKAYADTSFLVKLVKHTERLGCRGLDLLHVALALDLEGDVFLTADSVQGVLARAEGLRTTVIADE